MNRISRTVSAVVLSAALLVAVSPAAQARTPERHQASKPAVSLFDAALAWLSDLIVGPTHVNPRNTETKIYTSGSISGGTGDAVPMTGACIDPNGKYVPCGGVGGTGTF